MTVLADYKKRLVYSGIFFSNPAWFEREATSRSAAVAIGNFSSSTTNPSPPDSSRDACRYS